MSLQTSILLENETDRKSPMFEVEMKFRYENWAHLVTLIQSEGGAFDHEETNEDHYFNSPVRDFRSSDEVLRIRKIGDQSYLTYKGPKQASKVKSRLEREIPFGHNADASKDLREILISLGFVPTAIVRKVRKIYHFERDSHAIHVCLDDVENLGKFIEIEILTSSDKLEIAREVLMQLKESWNLPDAEPRSYISMQLQLFSEQGKPA
jgi:adenylate cyclase, class 2